MNLDQLIESEISDLKYNEKEFSFIIRTEITMIEEQSLSSSRIYKNRLIESLTSNPESYKREIINPINFANELRIALINNVEAVAITEIKIISNTTFIVDELVEHRLMLLPIRIDSYNLIWDIWNSDNYEVEGSIDVTADTDYYDITSDRIKFNDNRIKCVPKILIISLAKGQKLKCDIKATKGTGNTFFCPVSTVGFKILDNTSVELRPKLKGKLPALFVLFYALTFLETRYPLFSYKVEDKTFDKDENGNIILV